MKIKKHLSAVKRSVLLKVGVLSSIVYLSFGSTCPCCGTPLTACPVGFTSAGAVGFMSSSFFHFIERMSEMLSGRKKISQFSKKTPN
ncbi:MAG: hypothetical protein GY863_17690 [bacterium]|nr:hypothetical protein [bacterium]